MQKKKGLADMQDGEFILNESGTSVSTDSTETGAEDVNSEPAAGSDENAGDDSTTGTDNDDDA